ncbi:hypothetical protein QBC42DRAFT_274630 [Cladorrhinum samala]|uniref:Uncharacterized protein n=1 Tax=Cladorrhinum samala TaxID=585594 RepID=A0AAV9HGW1_9PEZI|nr:hypothetical protein QBC42DRAFT_274630 [Cladorrhinum samala]
MENDSNKTAKVAADTKAGSINGRFTSPLTIIGASHRRSLFSRPRSKEEPPHPASAGAPTEIQYDSPDDSAKIPRTSQLRPSQVRRPFTLTDAYHMAEEEEAAAQASPSPAPRAWRSRRDSSDKDVSDRKEPSRKSSESARDDTGGSAPSIGGRSQEGSISDASFDEKLRHHTLSSGTHEGPSRKGSSLFSKGLGSIVETGKGLVRNSTRGGAEANPSPRPGKLTPNGSRLSRLLSSRKRQSSNISLPKEPADLVQVGPEGQSMPNTGPSSRPPTAPADHPSPEKSFDWEADEDFTAGDLQVSNSPPVIVGRTNTKIDEIRALEAELADQVTQSLPTQQRNFRIDEIRALEDAASMPLPVDRYNPDVARSHHKTEGTENEEQAQVSNLRTAAGMEDRAREIDRLARRALATARLDEIGEKNTEHPSRSPSPDIARKPSNEPLRAISPLGNRRHRRGSYGTGSAVETREFSQALEKSSREELATKPQSLDAERPKGTIEGTEFSAKGPRVGNDARHSARRLSLPAGSGALANDPVRSIEDAWTIQDEDREAADTRRRRRIGSAKSNARLTVGFSGIRRSDSVESGLSKKSSALQSEPDPTDRIEGEMNLFAPLENQSERRSLRAMSPEFAAESDEEKQELPNETPKIARPDPLTQPTPRITGAFVETPVTVKAERLEEPVGGLGPDGLERQITDHSQLESKSSLRGRRISSAGARQIKQSQSMRGERSSNRAASVSARRRTRSLSRGRSLTNSARPPTVQDDLLEIQRANQIEDSTLEDIADLLGHRGSEDPGLVDDADVKSDIQDELDRYERMSRTIKNGLLGIQSAKQGIQRLEDKFTAGLKSSAAEPIKEEQAIKPPKDAISGAARDCSKNHPSREHHGHEKTDTPCLTCELYPSKPSSWLSYVPMKVPRLWYGKPFRPTLLGLIAFLLFAWYVAESTMCSFFCKPLYCYPGQPCDWSPDDPFWGFAIPVKLDQWTTGGRIRERMRELHPEMSDWVADLRDFATGTDITTVDTTNYDWWQRRQHRRRLYKKQMREESAREEKEAAYVVRAETSE